MKTKNFLFSFFSFFRNYFCREDKRKLLLILSLFFLILAGILTRAAVMYYMPSHFLHNDGGDYLNISEQLAKGNGFSKTLIHWYEATPPGYKGEPRTAFHRPPLLPLLGAIFFHLPFDVLSSAKVTVLLISAICILMVYLLSKEIFESRKTAFLAAFIYTFYPYSIYHGICFSSENLFLAFICATYFFIIKWMKKDLFLPYGALAGAMMALATLTRPQGFGLFLFLGFTGVLVMLFKKNYRKKMFYSLVSYTLGAFILLSPWMIRNWIAGGKPTPLTFYGPYSFAQASSEVSYMSYKYIDTPQYKEMTDKTWIEYHAEKRKILAEKKIYSLPEANPCWKKWAWEYIRNNPEKMWFIVKSRVMHCFRLLPNKEALPSRTIPFLLLFFIILFSFMVAGIYFARKNISAIFLLTAPLSVLIFAIPFMMVFRFRYPCFAPAAAIFASYAIVRLTPGVLSLFRKKQ